jgi:hypothetical protein
VISPRKRKFWRTKPARYTLKPYNTKGGQKPKSGKKEFFHQMKFLKPFFGSRRLLIRGKKNLPGENFPFIGDFPTFILLMKKNKNFEISF